MTQLRPTFRLSLLLLSLMLAGPVVAQPALTVQPGAIDQTVAGGASVEVPLTLMNVGSEPLEWSLPQFSQEVPAGASAPESYGYRWIDSNLEGGPAYAPVDISPAAGGPGVAIDFQGEHFAEVPLPFGFPFYGEAFEAVRVYRHGFLTFDDAHVSSPFSQQPIPSTNPPNALIASFWGFLVYNAISQVFTAELPDGRFVVQYHNIPYFYSHRPPNTWQVILQPDGQIFMYYMDIYTGNLSLRVGIENLEGTDGLAPTSFDYFETGLALRFLHRPPFIQTDLASGTIPAGEAVTISVTLDASLLQAGVHMNMLLVESSEPGNPVTKVPVELTVEGSGALTLEPGQLSFGDVALGGESTRHVTLSNSGFDVLEVTNIAVDDPAFSTTLSAPISLAPGEKAFGTATFAPSAIGSAQGALTISAAGGDVPPLEVPLSGTGVEPPELVVVPEHVVATAEAGSIVETTLQISNPGSGELTFSFPEAPPSARGSESVTYWARTSSDAGGPEFDWIDISATGHPVSFASGSADYQVDLPFAVPYYGDFFTTLTINGHGFVRFGAGGTNVGNSHNSPLPHETAPNGVIAVFWDRLKWFTYASGGAFYEYLGDGRFVVQWNSFPQHFGPEEGVTFQVVLHEDGTILMQYHTVPEDVYPFYTVGVENLVGTEGLQVAYNEDFVESGLAVRIARGLPYIAGVSPQGGVLEPGGSADVAITLDATELLEGTYDGTLPMLTNAPGAGRLNVPVSLQVSGEPNLVPSAAELHFEHVVVGQSRTRVLALANSGTGGAALTGVSTPPGFAVADLPDAVPPQENVSLAVTFSPTQIGAAGGDLVIETDAGSITVALTGEGSHPPALVLQTESIEAAATSGQAVSATLSLTNEGAGPLFYRLPQLDRGHGDILGRDTGGPDQFGYTWIDSNEPGGPAFEWVEISHLTDPLAMGANSHLPGSVVVDLPFTFFFYGQPHDQARVCTNGMITFEVGSEACGPNRPFPSHFTPNAVIAALWSPHWGSLVHATPLPDGRFAVQWHTRGSGQSNLHFRHYHFQLILDEHDAIRFQYRELELPITQSYSIGIEDHDGTDGLTVFHAMYGEPDTFVHDSLAVLILPPTHFVGGATPASGWIDPGQSVDVAVLLDAAGLNEGTYQAELILTSNDPEAGHVDIPVTLDVSGSADLVASPSNLNFGEVFAGAVEERQVTVTNAGSQTILVDEITVSGEAFATAEGADTFALPPAYSHTIGVHFAPNDVGPYDGQLTFVASGAEVPPLVVPLAGSGTPPPIGHIDDLIFTDLPEGTSTTASVILTNVGQSPLEYSLRLVPGGLEVPEPPATRPPSVPRTPSVDRWDPSADEQPSDVPTPPRAAARSAEAGDLLYMAPYIAGGRPTPRAWDIAMAPDGVLLVADRDHGVTTRFTTQLQVIGEFDHPVGGANHRTYGIAYNDDTQSLWYLDIGPNESQPRLIEASIDGAPTGAELALPEIPSTAFSGLAYSERTGRFYTLDYWQDHIYAFESDGSVVPGFPVPQTSGYTGSVPHSGWGLDALGDFLDVQFGFATNNHIDAAVVTDLVGVNAGPATPLAQHSGLVIRGGPVRDRAAPNELMFMTQTAAIYAFRPDHRIDLEPFIVLAGAQGGVVPPGGTVEIELLHDALDLPPDLYAKRLRVETNSPTTPVLVTTALLEVQEAEGGGVPTDPNPSELVFGLDGAYPNPFRSSITFEYTLPEAAHVSLELFDTLGRRVASVVDGEVAAGRHEAALHGAALAAGVYVYRLQAGRQSVTGRVVRLP